MEKSSENYKQKKLVRELQSLRKGAGIASGKLHNAVWLRDTIGYRTGIDAASLTGNQMYTYLLRELDKLGDSNNIEAEAIRNAFAVHQEDNPRTLTERRAALSIQLSRHTDTVEAYENRGITELARRLNTSDTRLSQQNLLTSSSTAQEAIVPFAHQTNAARNMVTQGLFDLYTLGPRAAEIHEVFGRHATPYLDSSVDMIFLPSRRGDDWYTIKLSHTFQARLKSYRIGFVRAIHDCEILMASGIVDDVIKINKVDSYDREIATILKNCGLFAREKRNGRQKSFIFMSLDAETKQSILSPLWQIDAKSCEIFEAQITEKEGGLNALYEYRWSDEGSTLHGQYAYWYAPGLTYLNHLIVDTSRFPGYEKWNFTILPFLGPFCPSISEPSNERYTLAANSWIMQGQGVAVTWEKR